MSNKHIPPAVGEFAVGERDQLLARIAEQAREIERLRLNIAEYNEHERCYQSEIAALKAQPSGVVLPERKTKADFGVYIDEFADEAAAIYNRALDEVARLNSSTVSAGVVDDRAAFEAAIAAVNERGWTTSTDLARQIWEHARAALSAPSHGEQVRHMVPDGWQLVPVEPTPEMISAAEEAHMPFGDMDIALRCALFAAPSAGSQGGDV